MEVLLKMEIREFNNFKDAFRALTPEDEESHYAWHSLESGEEIKTHFHPKANEWLVINHGKFAVALDGEEQEFNLKRRVAAIFFPARKEHALVAKSKIFYFVIRDRKDKTVYQESQK